MPCSESPDLQQRRPQATIDDGKRGECCIDSRHPVRCGYLLSTSLLLLGIVLLSVGMLRPKPYVFDPTMAARDMEVVQMRYVQSAQLVRNAFSNWSPSWQSILRMFQWVNIISIPCWLVLVLKNWTVIIVMVHLKCGIPFVPIY